jgi:hypothetical protein
VVESQDIAVVGSAAAGLAAPRDEADDKVALVLQTS